MNESKFNSYFCNIYEEICFDYRKTKICTKTSVKFTEILFSHYFNLSTQ